MKVLHTIAGFGIRRGGTTTCTYDLLKSINEMGIRADLLTPGLAAGDDDVMAGCGEKWIKTVPNDCRSQYEFSYNLRHYLHKNEYDIYHSNGMWLYANHAPCAYARRRGKPYVISPHGMLYPEALSQSALVKKAARRLIFNKDLQLASCLHATCDAEAKHLRALGLKNPIAVISNPLNIPANIDSLIEEGSKSRTQCSAVGYLGRLHPRKNVHRIIEAFASVARSEQKLVIMGSGDAEYENILRQLVGSLGISQQVEFAGFVGLEKKLRRIAGLRALVVASDFENFGMIVGEALMCRTPVICTNTAPWEALRSQGMGWWIDNDIPSLGIAIRVALNLPLVSIETRGQRGRDWVEYDYTPSVIAQRMIYLYQWLVGNGPKPEFVI